MKTRFISALLVLGGMVPGTLNAGTTPADSPVVGGPPQLYIWDYPAYPPEALKQKVEGTVMVRAVVNEEGDVTTARVVAPVDPRLDAAAVETVKGWKFTPGAEFGQPATYSMDVPIRFSTTAVHKKVKLGMQPPFDLLPQPSPRTYVMEKSTPGGEYPEILTARKIRGTVTFACIVTTDGRAVAPRVTGATHVDFIQPALAALALWEFTPAAQGDVPAKAPYESKITFEALSNSREEILASNGLTAPDGGVAPLAPEPYIVTDPVQPYDLLMAGQGGSAAAEFTVTDSGAVTAVKLRAATAPEFGRALVAALETWGFNTAMANGRTVAVPLRLRVEFKAVVPGQESATDPVERLVAARRANRIGPPKDLDAKLAPVYRVPPAYPAALAGSERTAGAAEIEFVIDRDGRARLPRIVSATRDEFGWAAATAVSQWVFQPPRRAGEPVDVLVKIPFDFAAPRK